MLKSSDKDDELEFQDDVGQRRNDFAFLLDFLKPTMSTLLMFLCFYVLDKYIYKYLLLSNYQSISCSYFDIVRDVRQNKGSILKASVEYIKKLKVNTKKRYFVCLYA